MPKIFHIDAKCPYALGKKNGIKVCALFWPKRLKKNQKNVANFISFLKSLVFFKKYQKR